MTCGHSYRAKEKGWILKLCTFLAEHFQEGFFKVVCQFTYILVPEFLEFVGLMVFLHLELEIYSCVLQKLIFDSNSNVNFNELTAVKCCCITDI